MEICKRPLFLNTQKFTIISLKLVHCVLKSKYYRILKIKFACRSDNRAKDISIPFAGQLKCMFIRNDKKFAL